MEEALFSVHEHGDDSIGAMRTFSKWSQFLKASQEKLEQKTNFTLFRGFVESLVHCQAAAPDRLIRVRHMSAFVDYLNFTQWQLGMFFHLQESCRGSTWLVPLDRLPDVLSGVSRWARRNPGAPVAPLHIQTLKMERRMPKRPFLAPFGDAPSCAVWHDWFLWVGVWRLWTRGSEKPRHFFNRRAWTTTPSKFFILLFPSLPICLTYCKCG